MGAALGGPSCFDSGAAPPAPRGGRSSSREARAARAAQREVAGLVVKEAVVGHARAADRWRGAAGGQGVAPSAADAGRLMLWNLCVDMTSSGAPVLDRLLLPPRCPVHPTHGVS